VFLCIIVTVLFFFSSAETIPYEDVVKELAADTLCHDAAIGIGGGRFSPGSFSSLIHLEMKVSF